MSTTTLDPVERLLNAVDDGQSLIKNRDYILHTNQTEFYIETNNRKW